MCAKKTAALILCVLGFALAAWAQSQPSAMERNPLAVRPTSRISGRIDPQIRVTLSGNRHPSARPENLIGLVAPDQPLEHMVLVLRPDPAQEQAVQELIAAQQDPESPLYHQWLTPEAFGARFGVSQNDLTQVANWLESHGLRVDELPPSRRAIVFSGSAAQVETAFHAPMRRYAVNGQLHYANAADPEIPQALGEVIQGIASLHDFRSAPAHPAAPGAIDPAYNLSNGVTLLMPRDWATIYDVTPLYAQGLDGTGQSIAVVGRTDFDLTDVRTFRTNAALPANDPQKIFVNGVNPGMPDCEDEAESALDVEWAGALAKNATIKFVSAKSGTTDGIILAAQYAVNNNVAPIITVSYLHCESTLSDGGQSLWGNLWAQAAAQGQSIFVASGDSGAAGCDLAIAKTATQGKGVNAICTSPNSTCVGGTQFNEGYTPNLYWSSTNGSGQASALAYIPEAAWNETGWAGMINAATGGGVSTAYAKPAWQSAPGVPAGTVRYVPDIAATSAIHDAYVIQVQGKPFYIAGTSASSPSLASVMALVAQNAGARLGNINPSLYTLATQQAAGGPAVFHDITSGNNSVPGLTGYSAGTGYDPVTGLGSVDAFLLVNSWNNSKASNFSLASSAPSLILSPGGSATATLSLSAQGGFTAPVTLSAAGAPAGITVTFSSSTLTAAAPVTLRVAAAAATAAGSYPVAIIGSGGGFKRTVAYTVTVAGPTFTMTANPSSVSVEAGSSASIGVTLVPANGFNSAVALTASGLPLGVTAAFSPATVPAGGTTSTVNLSVSSSTAAGTYTISMKGTSGSITQTQPIALTVTAPSFTLALSAPSAAVTTGSSVPVTVTTTAGTGLTSTATFAVRGLPGAVTASFSAASTIARGKYSSTLTLSAAPTAVAGTYPLTVAATLGSATQTQAFSLTVLAATFTLTPSATSAGIAPGGSIPISLTTAAGAGFKSAISFSVTGLPTGVTAVFSPTSIASPGSGRSTLTLTATSSAAQGTYKLTVTAAGGGVTKTFTLSLTVSAPSTSGHR